MKEQEHMGDACYISGGRNMANYRSVGDINMVSVYFVTLKEEPLHKIAIDKKNDLRLVNRNECSLGKPPMYMADSITCSNFGSDKTKQERWFSR
jgi:hypothetical protein